jgi:hemerythrin-like metal-binding protein
MIPLKWSEPYILGIPELDQQHEVLFNGVNAVLRAVAEGIPEEDLKPLLNALLEFTRTHFEAEEQWMRRRGYPGLGSHQVQHQLLFDELTQVIFRAEAHEEPLRSKVVPRLKEWLVTHILEDDAQLAVFLRDSPEGL